MSTEKTKKELFEQLFANIKTKLGFSDEQKFMDVTTADGTALKIEGESLTEGAAVTVEDGTPAPDGEHTLSDGTVITVTEGKISAIKAAEPPKPSEEQMTIEQMRAVAKKFAAGTPDERVSNLEVIAKALMEYSFGWQLQEAQQKEVRDQAINVYKSSFKSDYDALKKENEKIKQAFSAQKEAVSALVEVVEEMANEPAAPPVVKKRSIFATDKPDPQARIQQIAEARKKINIQK